MATHAPPLAPVDDGSGVHMEEDVPSPVQHLITEEEVGDYKEQDRYLPVSASFHSSDDRAMFIDVFPLVRSPTSRAL